MIDEILQKIESTGIIGIKKADLKKAYGKDCEEIIEKQQQDEKIFIEKKGAAYFVWTAENYMLHLTTNDTKFKLMLKMFTGVNDSISRLKEQTHTLRQEMEDLSTREYADESIDFEAEFNKSLCESGTAVGWAPFSKIRETVCQTRNLSKEKFYTLATNLIEQHRERYEISSGGPEGVVVRGLVHGYVRNV